MRATFVCHRRFTSLPIAGLIALLQRTPVVQVAATAEDFVLASPVGAVLRSAAAAAVSLGAFHSLAGATALVAADTAGAVASPFQATVGTPIPKIVFDITGTQSGTLPASWKLAGTLPPGLSFNGMTAPGSSNAVDSALTGTPTLAGSYTIKLTGYGYSGSASGNDSTTTSSEFSFIIKVVAAATGVPRPVFSIQPKGQTMNAGSTVVFTGAASAGSAYAWQRNGVVLSDSPGSTAVDVVTGSAGPQLVISNATGASNGSYALVATNASGSTPSDAAPLVVAATATPGYLINISARAFVGTGDQILIGGFYIVGSTSRTVLIQALGPALVAQGVSGTLAHPALSIHDTTGATLYSNAGWGSSQVLINAVATAFATTLAPNSADAEALLTLPPGGYTAEISDANNTTGVALCAIYQLP